MTARRIGMLLVSAAAGLGCAAGGDQRSARDSLQAELDAVVPEAMDEGRVPGVAVGWVEDGTPAWTRGWGVTGDDGAPVDGETRFQVASVSKPVAAWVVLALADRDVLTLDAPVASAGWSPPASPHDPAGITLRRLLSHTAGLSVGGYFGIPPDEFDDPSTVDVLAGRTPGDGRVELIAPPGTDYRYSGGGYTVAQLAVEDAGGERFADVADREVLGPLGMTGASFSGVEADPLPVVATGHDAAGRPLPFYRYGAQAAASLVASARDLAAFLAANLDGAAGPDRGRGVLRPETVDQMLSAQDEADGRVGLGWRRSIFPDGEEIWFHPGNNRGWRSYVALWPARGDALVVLTNGDGGDAVVDAVRAAVLAR